MTDINTQITTRSKPYPGGVALVLIVAVRLKPYEDVSTAALYLQVSHVSAVADYSLWQCMIYYSI
jgi:hypothetical protein